MPQFVAFLRSVNVAGRIVRMAGLRAALEDAGYTDVETHIQSGNVRVGTAMRSPERVRAALEPVVAAYAGFPVAAILRTPSAVRELVTSIDAIPPLLEGEPRRYVALADAPIPDDASARLDAWAEPGERAVVLGDSVLADLVVDFHKIKLSNARIERITGRTTTWRDLKVLRAIDERWGA